MFKSKLKYLKDRLDGVKINHVNGFLILDGINPVYLSDLLNFVGLRCYAFNIGCNGLSYFIKIETITLDMADQSLLCDKLINILGCGFNG